jgi:callose synthase
VASGNGEQTLSRDVYRLGQLLDFPRMLSFFYTSVGFYVTTLVRPTHNILPCELQH